MTELVDMVLKEIDARGFIMGDFGDGDADEVGKVIDFNRNIVLDTRQGNAIFMAGLPESPQENEY
jgi:hypothetical protein